MKLISKVKIKGFRSVRDSQDALSPFDDFNAFVGLNNSGKSNIIKAINVFFTNQVDLNTSLDFVMDYNRFDLKRKLRDKAIEISIEFTLPSTFKFHSKIKNIEEYLQGKKFTITKKWLRDSKIPEYFFNDSSQPLDLADRQKIDQFLALINFRYIPNRVLPIDIIKSEHKALRDVLIRRLGKKGKESHTAFDTIQEISSELISSLTKRIKYINPETNIIKLDTPKDWADIIFAFGYRLGYGDVEIEDVAQGSGIQSLLMLETLYLIDKDYFQKFGWRQASIWAIEEPESSLHQSLETQVASFLREISVSSNSRLQIFSATHSEIVLQYANKQFFIEQKNNQTIIDGNQSINNIIEKSARAGISKYTHPILFYPTDPMILVDGKYDVIFIEKAIKMINPGISIRIVCLEDLNPTKTGGENNILSYLKNNKSILSCRQNNAPIIVVLDWESKEFIKYDTLSKELNGKLQVFQWPERKANPSITKNFRGTERFYSNRLIDLVNSKIPGKIGKTIKKTYTINRTDYEEIKKALYEEISSNGLKEADLKYSKEFIEEIVTKIQI